MSRIRLTERQWTFIRLLLPPPARTGRPQADDRRTIEDILYVLITGCRWQDLPHEYGALTTVWRRLKRWDEAGLWEQIWRAALAVLDEQGKLDWSIAFLDGSFVPAKNGGDKIGSPLLLLEHECAARSPPKLPYQGYLASVHPFPTVWRFRCP
jgi:transposase